VGSSPAHTFPSAGAYSVGLTIFAHDGTSTGNGGIVCTGHTGITPGFTVSANPVDGNPATFTGLARVSAQPVITYLWEFGDGTTGSGKSPKHTYSKAGTYR
jgi:PKD repeat protein